MLLALDVSNTNVTIGAFQGETLAGHWRLRTIKEQTADEWGILLRNLFTLSSLDLSGVHGVIISSVVPAVDRLLKAMAQRYFERSPMFVNYTTNLGIKVQYDNPREVGADRLVNGVAGFHKYGGPCIVVDLGTTINFDIVSHDGVFLGGVICPGIGMSIQGAVREDRAIAASRFPRAGKTDRVKHRRQHHLGFILRLYRNDRRDRGARRGGTGAGDESRRDGRAGQPHYSRVALRQDLRRGSDARWTTPDLGSQSLTQSGRALLQLLHGNRRTFPARARHGIISDVAARLGPD